MGRLKKTSTIVILAALLVPLIFVTALTLGSDIRIIIGFSVDDEDSLPPPFPYFFRQYLRYTDKIYSYDDPLTPLIIAAVVQYHSVSNKKQMLNVVDILINRGLDVNQASTYDGRELTALHYAVWDNEPEMVLFLLEHGADATHKARFRLGEDTYKAVTPLEHARWLDEYSHSGGDWTHVIAILENEPQFDDI